MKAELFKSRSYIREFIYLRHVENSTLSRRHLAKKMSIERWRRGVFPWYCYKTLLNLHHSLPCSIVRYLYWSRSCTFSSALLFTVCLHFLS